MPPIIESLSSSRLQEALDDNNITFWSSFSYFSGGAINPDSNFFWSVSGIPIYSYNGVLRCRLKTDQFSRQYGTFMERFQDLPLIWWIGAGNSPGNIAHRLQEEGWKDEGHVPAMAAPLTSDLERNIETPDFSIKLAQNPEEKSVWLATMNRGMGFSPDLIHKAVQVDRSLEGPPHQKQYRYTAFLGDRPVATALMLPDAGVAGIFGVATLPEARGQGLGRAMTLKAMQEAYYLGYRVATLVATPMGLPLYQRLGFKKLFSYHYLSWNWPT